MGFANGLTRLWRWLPLSFKHKQYGRHLLLSFFPFLRNARGLNASHLKRIQQPYPPLPEDVLKNMLPEAFTDAGQRRIILVAHDAHPHGGQYLVLHMAKYLKEALGFSVKMLVLGDGILMAEYARYANVHDLSGRAYRNQTVLRLLSRLHSHGYRYVLANTTVAGLLVPALKESGFYVCALVHELPGLIRKLGLQKHASLIAESADRIVFPAQQVKDGFLQMTECPDKKTVIFPQGLFRKNRLIASGGRAVARQELRRRFNLPEEARVVLSVGHADYRKGIDLFVESGIHLIRANPAAYLIWVGHFDAAIEMEIKATVQASGVGGHFIFPGMDFDTDVYYSGSDVYALTSREDPFPSVVLEAMNAGVPVVAFRGTGGFTGLLERAGVLVKALDTKALANVLVELLSNQGKAAEIGKKGASIVEKEFSFDRYMLELLSQCSALDCSSETERGPGF